MHKIPIIDLFAGPGGLGEGFMSVTDDNGHSVFDIRLSIEKDENAHKTLLWRSFYRQFVKEGRSVPMEYYQAYEEKDLKRREEIIEKTLKKYKIEGDEAKEEARKIELGVFPDDELDEIIRKQLGKAPEDWVLIGGPPCQAYSNVGRSRVGGIHKEDHRVYLYQQYLRIIKEHNPAVFVMENVKGLLSAKIDGQNVFDLIYDDLQLDGKYKIHSFVREAINPRDFLIKAEDYGVPQRRHRVILLGIREGLNHSDKYLEHDDHVSLEKVIDKIPAIRSVLNRKFVEKRKDELNQLGRPRRIYKMVQDSDRAWLKLINQNIEHINRWNEFDLNGLSDGLSATNSSGSEFEKHRIIYSGVPKKLKEWYSDKKLKGLANHESRAHLTQDLMRYMYSALYVEKTGDFPRLEQYLKHKKHLAPDHDNVKSGKFNDRFRVQLPDKPATTVTSHISKDGHYFIHYDPKQCRSLTVREAARIQTFPDNYLFRGSRTQQYHQVGNAVPPYLAMQLAEIVRSIVKR